MPPLTALAGIAVVACGLWLIGLAGALIFLPERSAAFLRLFASSARAHYTEQLLRLAAGAALVVFAPEMRFAGAFRLFGWVLVSTALALMLVPWRWHHRFAGWATPWALGHPRLLALGAFALGALLVWAVL